MRPSRRWPKKLSNTISMKLRKGDNVIMLAGKDRGKKAKVLATPKLTKAVINVGVGRFFKEDKTLERIASDLAKLSGQKPTFRTAKKSIASFKIRQGVPVGITVTLRGKRMYDFADRFINIAL